MGLVLVGVPIVLLELRLHPSAMTRRDVDEYLDALPEPQRATLGQLRETIAEIVPDAEQCLSYGMPAFRLRGTVVAGFAAFTNHLSYLPHSGSVLAELSDELTGYRATKGHCTSRWTSRSRGPVEALVAVRVRQAFPDTDLRAGEDRAGRGSDRPNPVAWVSSKRRR